MKHKALVRRLQISCLGLDRIDPLRLLVDDVIEALAQHDSVQAKPEPEQEPVVWMYQDKSTHEVRFQKHMRDFVDHGATYETPLYTTLPQHTWIGLTDDDKAELDEKYGDDMLAHFDAIEAKLKERNT